MKAVWIFFLMVLSIFPALSRADEGHGPLGTPPEQIGEVHFLISCDPSMQKPFNRAVALLHSFWYDEAKRAFAAVAESDPRCAMAHWGVAMTLFHPLWGMPDEAALKEGAAAIGKALAIGGGSDREKGYIEALALFYQDADPRNHRARSVAYEQAMEALAARFPDDREATIFYALALNGTAFPDDRNYTNQKKAGSLLEPLLAEMPNHPGVAHYLIHSYDSPLLASRALSAARAYAKIAPSVPHALHMPSHIFTRLGLWQESITSNIASANAAEEQAILSGNPAAREPKFHAMDYLVYAYLQTGGDIEAKKLLEILKLTRKDIPEGSASAAYAASAIPARYYFERHRWTEGLAIITQKTTYPWTDALIHFARAVGAARADKKVHAQVEINMLAAIRDHLKRDNQGYWADQVEVQRRAAEGWLAHAKGENGPAVQFMRTAADLEDSMEKHPVTPGPILPAREMLAELYMEVRFPKEALASYEAVLATAPNRFNALAGAAHAAEQTKDLKKARSYYEKLLSVAGTDSPRPEVKEAKDFLAKSKP
jgi:tetratricopeptide (TPR) repeat protein